MGKKGKKKIYFFTIDSLADEVIGSEKNKLILFAYYTFFIILFTSDLILIIIFPILYLCKKLLE